MAFGKFRFYGVLQTTLSWQPMSAFDRFMYACIYWEQIYRLNGMHFIEFIIVCRMVPILRFNIIDIKISFYFAAMHQRLIDEYLMTTHF